MTPSTRTETISRKNKAASNKDKKWAVSSRLMSAQEDEEGHEILGYRLIYTMPEHSACVLIMWHSIEGTLQSICMLQRWVGSREIRLMVMVKAVVVRVYIFGLKF